jgi:hypothetical protein
LGSAHAEPDGTSTAHTEWRVDAWRAFGPWRLGERSYRASLAGRSVDEGEQVGRKLAQPEQVFTELRKGRVGRLFERVDECTRDDEWDEWASSSSTFTGRDDALARCPYRVGRDQHRRRTWRISRDHVPLGVDRSTDELAFSLPHLAAYELGQFGVSAHARRPAKL